MTKCAVCEKPMKKVDAPAKTTHLDVAYYFCGEKCEKAFEADRSKYMKKNLAAV